MFAPDFHPRFHPLRDVAHESSGLTLLERELVSNVYIRSMLIE